MSIVYAKYIPFALAAICLLFFIQLKLEINFYRWVKTYWFYSRKFRIVVSSILKLLGFSLLILSLLDFRGEEEKTKLQVSDQKTIILIDSSASMLAEDIRPNRFKIWISNIMNSSKSGSKWNKNLDNTINYFIISKEFRK